MIRLITISLLLVHAAHAASPLAGFWYTQDRGGVIAITPCGADMLCARIAGMVLDQPQEPTPLDYRGVSQCHLPIITDARRVAPERWRGHITDPRSGHVYDVELRPNPNGTMALRGFLGFTLLGRTQTWTRYPGTPPADCRLYVPGRTAEGARGK